MVVYKVTLYGNGRSFDRLKNLTGHFVHTEPLNIFALFTRNFEPLSVLLNWLRVYGTPTRVKLNPFAPKPPVTARADPRPFYPL